MWAHKGSKFFNPPKLTCSQIIEKSSVTPLAPLTNYEQWLQSNQVVIFNDIYSSYGEFSNAFPSPLNIPQGYATHPLKAKTVEHYYHSQKFKGTMEEITILDLSTPEEVIRVGKDPRFPLRTNWMALRDQVMMEALNEKFRSNSVFAKLLLETRKKQLVFHTPYDLYWGDGGDGSGHNKLGELLMALRKELLIENETYRYKANTIKEQTHLTAGPSFLHRPDFIFSHLDEISYFPQESRNLIDQLSAPLVGILSEKAFSQLESTIQNGNVINFRVLLNIMNPSHSGLIPRTSLHILRFQDSLRIALWAALRLHKPEILTELLALEAFDSRILLEPKEPTGLNALSYSVATGNQDLFDIMYDKVKHSTPPIDQAKVNSYFFRFPFIQLKDIGSAEIATGVVTEEIYTRIMGEASIKMSHRRRESFETLNIRGQTIEQIHSDAPFLGTPDELIAFIERINELATSQRPEDIKLLAIIDPQRDHTKKYFYEPITEDIFHHLIQSAQISTGEFVKNLLGFNNQWALKPYLLVMPNEETAVSLRDFQPLLIHNKDSSFPTAFYGLLGLPLYCNKNSKSKTFDPQNSVRVQWGLSHHIENKRLIFHQTSYTLLGNEKVSALLLRRVPQ